MLYGVGVRVGAAADLLHLARHPSRHLAACILVEVHLPDSVDRAAQPGIGNYAMFVVWLVGRCGRGIAQLFGVFHSETFP